jgi:hypothetical protein
MKGFIKNVSALLGIVFLIQFSAPAMAADPFDPTLQPLGRVGDYTLSKDGLADGNGVIFRPYFDQNFWWGDLESADVSSSGVISSTLNWSAKARLDAVAFGNRKIHVNDGGTVYDVSAAGTAFTSLSGTFQTALVDQGTFDFIRGDRSGEFANGGTYRNRATVLGDFINTTPVYVEYNANVLSYNRIYISGNDGMLHVFNASTGDEIAAFIPAEVVSRLKNLSDVSYNDAHEYFVDGQIAVADVDFGDGNGPRKVLVGGLGGGGQAFYALDVTGVETPSGSGVSGPPTSDLTSKLLWEINDSSSGYTNLGYSYSRPIITQVDVGTPAVPDIKWVAIVGNGYGNKNPSASGTATLLVIDLATGALIKELDTLAGTNVNDDPNLGDIRSPNGLSDPAAIDILGGADGVTDYVYAGDLDGNVWRFDLDANNTNDASTTDLTDLWAVADFTTNSPTPFAILKNNLDDLQPVTSAPRVLRHPNGGVMVVVATGRMLSVVDSASTTINSIYGLRDRLDDTKPSMPVANTPGSGKLVVQDLTSTLYTLGGTSTRVRVSSNIDVDQTLDDGWLVDLPQGERVITQLTFRSGRVLLSTINPTLFNLNLNTTAETWTIELNFLTGGPPFEPLAAIYDLNGNNVLSSTDNVDENGNSVLTDREDIVTGLFQGAGIVISGPLKATLGAQRGTFFVNRLQAVVVEITEPPLPDDPGLVGGHFDLDTTKLLSTSGTVTGVAETGGSTDGHTHQYDDKFDVKGADYFNMLPVGGNLHSITRDITDTGQHFKLVILNADKSTGGRLAINTSYDQSLASPSVSDYVNVVDYSNLGSANSVLTLSDYLDNLQIYTICPPTTEVVAPGPIPPPVACTAPDETLTSGATSVKLAQLGIYFDVLAILNGELIPTETSCIKDNAPSYVEDPATDDLPATVGDWRNSSLTIWALAVDADGVDQFELITDPATGKIVGLNPNYAGAPVAGEGGLLWESTLFWHWKGGCAHEYPRLDVEIDPTTGSIITPFNFLPTQDDPLSYFTYFVNETLSQQEQKEGGRDSTWKDLRKTIKDGKFLDADGNLVIVDGELVEQDTDKTRDVLRDRYAQELYGEDYDDIKDNNDQKDAVNDEVDKELDRLTNEAYEELYGDPDPEPEPDPGGGGNDPGDGVVDTTTTNSPPGSLSNPNRVSWGEWI